MSPVSTCLLGLLATVSPSIQDGFVERSAELGLIHELSTGYDGVAVTAVEDWMQRGLASGDIDGDGDVDIVAMGGALRNTVLRNDGGTFTDVTSSTAIEVGDFDTSPALGDYDRDGDLDLYVGVVEGGGFGGHSVGRSRLYRNEGPFVFEDVTALAGVEGGGHTLFAQWADLDYDGYLDLLLSEFYTSPNIYYRNNTDGTFLDLSDAVGLSSGGSTHVTTTFDSDGDGFMDVFVGNDYIVSSWAGLPDNVGDFHLASQGGDTWLDVSAGSSFDHLRGIMAYALGDVDYDGDFDVYKTDLGQNPLSINQGWPADSPWLSDEQVAYGIQAEWVKWHDDPTEFGPAVAWGAVFLDVNLDSWIDLFLVNGMVGGIHTGVPFTPRNQRNFLYTGDGPGLGFTFTDRTQALGLFDQIDDRCISVTDLDKDGDLDLFVAPTSGTLRYYENQIDAGSNGYLAVRPVCGTSAAGGFGTLVRYTDSLGYPHIRVIGADGSTASQHEVFAHLGLGAEPTVNAEVEFLSGLTLSFPGTPANSTLTPVEPELVRVSAHTLPIASNPGLPGSNRKPAPTTPLDLLAVDAFAHDVSGTPLDAAARVAIEVSGLVAETTVLSLGGNHFRRYFQAPGTSGAYRAEVTFDGWTPRVRPRVQFFDPADASGTTVEVRPEAVRAGTGDTFEVIVAPKDAAGLSLGPGDTVDVQIAGLTPLAGPTDLGDGRYHVTFLAPATDGIHPITIVHEGVTLTVLAQIEAGGVASLATSSLLKKTPHINTSAAPHQIKILFTPRDANGVRLGPYGVLEIVPVPDAGTDPVLVRTDLYPVGQLDGDYPAIVEKALTDPATTVSGQLLFSFDGVLQATLFYSY